MVDRRRLRAGAAARRAHRVAHVRHAARAAGRRSGRGRRPSCTTASWSSVAGASRRSWVAPPRRGTTSCRRSTGTRAGRAPASRAAPTLVVFCTEVVNADGPPGFGFRVVGTVLATFDLPSLTFTGRVRVAVHRTRGHPVGHRRGARRRLGLRVRRGLTRSAAVRAPACASIASPPDRGSSGPVRAWGDRDALVPMTFAGATPGDARVRHADVDGVRRSLRSRHRSPTRPSPVGPRPRRRVRGDPPAPSPPRSRRGGQYAYDARAVDLGRAGWAVVYNVNDPVAVATDPTVYGGRFVPAPFRASDSARGSGAASRTPSLTVR